MEPCARKPPIVKVKRKHGLKHSVYFTLILICSLKRALIALYNRFDFKFKHLAWELIKNNRKTKPQVNVRVYLMAR
jgi:hypothetical protein